MGHRLSSIATRTGDRGTTGLGDGTRVPKFDPRIATMGEVDELSSAIGLLLAFGLPRDLALVAALEEVQQDLLDLGGELSIPGLALLRTERVDALDHALVRLNATLPRLQEFVRPGGTIPAAQAHMCRTICRRAERSLSQLGEHQTVGDTARQYLNRLSDLMFVIARALNQAAGEREAQWDRERVG